ncbi:MAG: FAD-dependent oxidoreductase [Pseudorhodoplanes sp.]
MKTRTAEIAGGGIGGLSLAWALATYGWKVRVHERSPAIRDIGAGIYLMDNSLSIFEHHGLADELMSDGVVYIGTERREHNGSLTSRRLFKPGQQWYGLVRSDLLRKIASFAERAGVEIVLDSHIKSIDPKGALVSDNGEVHQADLVVAADGWRSRLRDQLGLLKFAGERNSGAIRCLIPRGEMESDLMAREFWSGRFRVGVVAVSPTQTYTFLSSPNAASEHVRLPINTAPWKKSFPVLRDFFDRITPDISATRNPYAYVSVNGWHKGRAAVIGDACHALPPTLAQGAGLAITNGYALAHTLSQEADVQTALETWQKKYWEVTQRTQNWSLLIDVLTTRWPRPLTLVRRGVVRALAFNSINSYARVADRVRMTSSGVAVPQ